MRSTALLGGGLKKPPLGGRFVGNNSAESRAAIVRLLDSDAVPAKNSTKLCKSPSY